MRVTFFGLFLTAVAVGCAAKPEPAAPEFAREFAPGAQPEPAPAPRAAGGLNPARDLKLVASFDQKYAHTGTHPEVTLTLVNTSATITYPVPVPQAGCERGRYEPHLSFAAEQRMFKGTWEPAAPHGGPGCGLYGVGSKDTVAELKPGAKLELTKEGFTGHFHTFRYAGRVRMTATYEYLRPVMMGGPGAPVPAALAARAPLEAMRGSPPFKLVSNAVEFDVVMPLNIAVRAKRALKVGETAKLSELLEVTLTNTTRDTAKLHRFGDPALSHVAVNVNSPELVTARRITFAPEPKGPFGGGPRTEADVMLERNDTVSLLGAGALAHGADAEWTGRKKGTFPICVEFASRDWNSGEKLFAFAEVTVE